jgi:lipopolysaccharide transport system permease protein
MELNPMFAIVSAYHDILVYAKTPDIQQIAVTTVIALGLLLLGLFMFRRAAPEMVDVL